MKVFQLFIIATAMALTTMLAVSAPFKYVADDALYSEVITELSKDYTLGYPDNTFRPNTKKAAEKEIRIIPVASSGIDKETGFLLRSMAIANNGVYVFSTNHSGVGNSHIEPSNVTYSIELLNELLLQIIKDRL